MSGSLATKPERLVDPSEPIELVRDNKRFVSRGGEKLEAALDEFGIAVAGLRCLDVGASTGGFTDCLLQRGAASVIAVDVGHGHLAWSLREDPRVEVIERTDVRDLDPQAIGAVDLVTVDLSFISLRTVLASLKALAGRAPVVALVKPQFELPRSRVPTGGVVRDDDARSEAVRSVIAAAEAAGFRRDGSMESPVAGVRGNREIFLLLRPA